jgi:hypothetical protein
VTNTQACLGTAKISGEESFIEQATGVNVKKLYTAIIYEWA